MKNHKGTGKRVLQHPFKEGIIDMLQAGSSPREVERFLKKKYPGKPQYHISWLTIAQFRTHYLKMEHDAILALSKQHREAQRKEQDIADLTALQNSEQYQQGVVAIQKEILDNQSVLDKAYQLCVDRINALSQQQMDHHDEKNLVSYISQIRQLFLAQQEFLGKLRNAKSTEININVGAVQNQITEAMIIMQEVLSELAPELIPQFLMRFKERMQAREQEANPRSVKASFDNLKQTVDVTLNMGSPERVVTLADTEIVVQPLNTENEHGKASIP